MTEAERRAELLRIVTMGAATDDELAEFFGADLMNQLAAQWRGEDQTRRLFTAWYVEVMEPLGIEADSAFALFKGEIAIEQFVQRLSDEQLADFLEQFPALQAAHQARIESGEAR